MHNASGFFFVILRLQLCIYEFGEKEIYSQLGVVGSLPANAAVIVSAHPPRIRS